MDRFTIAFFIVSIVSFLELMVYYLKGKPKCNSQVRLVGKTAIVTGSNTGIGKEVARKLSRRGARVIMACRNLEKANAAAVEIEAETGGKIEVRQLDLASLASVRAFANKILEENIEIHILVNNAGMMAGPFEKTVDGFERQLAVNHLGHFLLTNMLLGQIKAAAPSRIINVSSIAHKAVSLDFSDLQLERSYSPMKSYCRTKLANILFTKELAKRLEGTGVTVYAPHPGLVASDVGVGAGGFMEWWFEKPLPYFGKSCAEGAETLEYCAVAEETAHETGLYYNDCGIASTTKEAGDSAAAHRLWNISCELVKWKC